MKKNCLRHHLSIGLLAPITLLYLTNGDPPPPKKQPIVVQWLLDSIICPDLDCSNVDLLGEIRWLRSRGASPLWPIQMVVVFTCGLSLLKPKLRHISSNSSKKKKREKRRKGIMHKTLDNSKLRFMHVHRWGSPGVFPTMWGGGQWQQGGGLIFFVL